MQKTIAIHSFRRGAGKSSLAANLAALLAQSGKRVAVLDTDFWAPGLQTFFRLPEREISGTLNDFFSGRCPIDDAVYDIGPQVGLNQGSLYLLPASSDASVIMEMARGPYDIDRINEGITRLYEVHRLDAVLLDTPAGLNEETLSAMAVAHTLLVVLRPEPTSYQGTAVTLDVARSLKIPHIHLVLNDAPASMDPLAAAAQLEKTYCCSPAFVLPHSEDLIALASARLLALTQPGHPLTLMLAALAEQII